MTQLIRSELILKVELDLASKSSNLSLTIVQHPVYLGFVIFATKLFNQLGADLLGHKAVSTRCYFQIFSSCSQSNMMNLDFNLKILPIKQFYKMLRYCVHQRMKIFHCFVPKFYSCITSKRFTRISVNRVTKLPYFVLRT